MQNDEPSWQCFVPSHRPEQQSSFDAHPLPAVLQLVLSGVHMPSAPQLPPQQASLPVHAAPSERHWFAEHTPPSQLSEQQSVPVVHGAPLPAQVVIAETQPVDASHAPEQQSPPDWQASPTPRHALLAPPCAGPPAKLWRGLPAWPGPSAAPTPALAPAAEPTGSPRVEVVPPQPVAKAVAVMRSTAKILTSRILNLRGVARARGAGLVRLLSRRVSGAEAVEVISSARQ